MSDEVSQFLEQVERLRGQQIEEDEVRARELEEYLAAKRERQARREGEFCDRLNLFNYIISPPKPCQIRLVAMAATLNRRPSLD